MEWIGDPASSLVFESIIFTLVGHCLAAAGEWAYTEHK